jgi:DNA-3-methyladenine glycosylase I
VTYIHRRLWPAVVRLADKLDKDLLAAIREDHMASGSHRVVEISFPEWVPSKERETAYCLTEEEALSQLGEELVRSLGLKAPRGVEMRRCPWAKTDLYIQYHDNEWGMPIHDDRLLFEFLILEGAQAGLSWETILNKRENYRNAFDRFDPTIVAKYGQKKRKSLLSDSGIVRNRLKIEAAIQNAKSFLAVQGEFGTFDKYIWGFVEHEPKQNAWKSITQVPAKTSASDAMSKDLKHRGFKFVGSTICYAFMQAVGMVNDHLVVCFRHGELLKAAAIGNGRRD